MKKLTKKEQAELAFQFAHKSYQRHLQEYKLQANLIERMAISFVYDGWIYWCCGAISMNLTEKIFS